MASTPVYVCHPQASWVPALQHGTGSIAIPDGILSIAAHGANKTQSDSRNEDTAAAPIREVLPRGLAADVGIDGDGAGGPHGEVRPQSDLMMFPDQAVECDDLTNLPALSEAELLHAIRARFWRSKVYTNIGSMLVSVNPFTWQRVADDSPLSRSEAEQGEDIAVTVKPEKYSRELMHTYRKCEGDTHSLPPHVFALAERSFSAVSREGKSQCILINGESGSGKTEAAKAILKYLVEASRDNGKGSVSILSRSVATTNNGKLSGGSFFATGATATIIESSKAADVHDSSTSGHGRSLLSADQTVVRSDSSGSLLLADNSATPHAIDIDRELWHATPLLEAFGNAKTVHNDNSSRFGKWIKCYFAPNSSGRLIGARVEAYLLEKSRVAQSALAERKYHIFYQLCAGANIAERRALFLPPHHKNFPAAAKFELLAGSAMNADGNMTVPRACLALDDIDDAEQFAKVRHALTLILSADGRRDILTLVSAVLHLGNIAFVGDVEQAEIALLADGSPPPGVRCASKLLGVEPAQLMRDLTSRSFVTGAGRASFYKIRLNQVEAAAARDALAKALYSRGFEWLVRSINRRLRVTDDVASSAPFIGILDIFGFEQFQRNGFEQFCINYANERLQQIFTSHCLRDEQANYESEGLVWKSVSFTDNAACLALLEGKPDGVISLLDEECRVPQGNDLGLLEKLNQKYGGETKRVLAGRGEPGSHWVPIVMGTQRGRDAEMLALFCIRHYAADVEYSVSGFLEKNKDVLHPHLEALMGESKFAFVAGLFSDTNSGTEAAAPEVVPRRALGSVNAFPRRRGVLGQSAQVTSPQQKAPLQRGANGTKVFGRSSQKTLAGEFRFQLSELIAAIDTTEPHFIRCISPNVERRPDLFDGKRVCHQLRCAGLLDTVRVRKAGFEHRRSFDMLLARYRILDDSTGLVRDRCATMLHSSLTANCETDVRFAVGRTCAFLTESALRALDAASEFKLQRYAIVLQQGVRSALARSLLCNFWEDRQAMLAHEEEDRRTLAAVVAMQSAVRAVAARFVHGDLVRERAIHLQREANERELQLCQSEENLLLKQSESRSYDRSDDGQNSDESDEFDDLPGIATPVTLDKTSSHQQLENVPSSSMRALLAISDGDADLDTVVEPGTNSGHDSLSKNSVVRYEDEISQLRAELAEAKRLEEALAERSPVRSGWTAVSVTQTAADRQARLAGRRAAVLSQAREQIDQRRMEGNDRRTVETAVPLIQTEASDRDDVMTDRSTPTIIIPPTTDPVVSHKRGHGRSRSRSRSRSPSLRGTRKQRTTARPRPVPQTTPCHSVTRLHQAVAESDMHSLKKSLSPEKASQLVGRALQHPSDKKSVAEVLRKSGVGELNDLNREDQTALLLAILEEEDEMVEYLLSIYQAAMTAADDVAAGRGGSRISLSAKPEPVSVPLSDRATFDINTRCFPGGSTLLHVVCQTRQTVGTAFARLCAFPLLQFDVENDDGVTPLHYLAAHFPGSKDDGDRTARETFELFIKGGARVNAHTLSTGETPLHRAALNHHADIDVARELVRVGADMDARTLERRNSETPLHWAVHMRSELLVLFLVRHGADPAAKSADGRTPYTLARDIEKSSRIAACLRLRVEQTDLISPSASSTMARVHSTRSQTLVVSAATTLVSRQSAPAVKSVVPRELLPVREDTASLERDCRPWFLAWEVLRRRLELGFDSTQLEVPPAVRETLEYLAENGGFEKEGIFRESGFHSETKKIARMYRRGAHNVDLAEQTEGSGIHTVAGVLKQWLRDAFQPLFPYEMYPALKWAINRGTARKSRRTGDETMSTRNRAETARKLTKLLGGDSAAAAAAKQSIGRSGPPKIEPTRKKKEEDPKRTARKVKLRVRSLSAVLRLLPPGNQAILGEVFRFLHIVDACNDVNKMNASNLAIVFAPTLFRRGVSAEKSPGMSAIDAVHQSLAESKYCQKIVAYLIRHFYEAFDFLYEKPPHALEDEPVVGEQGASSGSSPLPAEPASWVIGAKLGDGNPSLAALVGKSSMANSEPSSVSIQAGHPKRPYLIRPPSQYGEMPMRPESAELLPRTDSPPSPPPDDRNASAIEGSILKTENQPWFLDLDRAQAEDLLRSFGGRSMLLARPSSNPGCYAITVLDCRSPGCHFFVHYLVQSEYADGVHWFRLVDTGFSVTTGANQSGVTDNRLYGSLAQMIRQSPVLSSRNQELHQYNGVLSLIDSGPRTLGSQN